MVHDSATHGQPMNASPWRPNEEGGGGGDRGHRSGRVPRSCGSEIWCSPNSRGTLPGLLWYSPRSPLHPLLTVTAPVCTAPVLTARVSTGLVLCAPVRTKLSREPGTVLICRFLVYPPCPRFSFSSPNPMQVADPAKLGKQQITRKVFVQFLACDPAVKW